jgi:hypothetical protein
MSLIHRDQFDMCFHLNRSRMIETRLMAGYDWDICFYLNPPSAED